MAKITQTQKNLTRSCFLLSILTSLKSGLTFSQTTNLDSSKVKEIEDDNFKFDENCRKFSKWVDTLWKKEKLLDTRNLSSFHSVCKRLVLQTCKSQGLFGIGLRVSGCLTHYQMLKPLPDDKLKQIADNILKCI